MKEFFMQNRELIAQIIGFAAMLCAIITYQFKKHRTLMLMLLLTAGVWSLHFLVLGKMTGVMLNLLSALRCLIYYFHDEGKKWAQPVWIPVAFGVIFTVATAFTWAGPLDILPLVSTYLFTYSNWQQDERKMKYITLPASMMWLVYNAFSGSVAGVANEIFAETSIVVYLVRTRKNAKKQAAES